jgi:3-methyladenine DNA glycosylase AlkD
MNTIIADIRQELMQCVDEETKEGGQRYFKEEVKLHGVKTAVVGEISKKYFSEIKEKEKGEIFDLCEELWRSGYLEESFIACNWSYAIRKRYEEKDLEVCERWLEKYVSNWASCDTLCNHTVGTHLEMYPAGLSALKRWAASPNRWMRRAAAVSLVVPARKGLFLDDIFEIAVLLLTDRDDMVQKGYGWMLKAASQSDQEQVFAFVMDRKDSMPRTPLRYAIEKMPPELKRAAMSR